MPIIPSARSNSAHASAVNPRPSSSPNSTPCTAIRPAAWGSRDPSRCEIAVLKPKLSDPHKSKKSVMHVPACPTPARASVLSQPTIMKSRFTSSVCDNAESTTGQAMAKIRRLATASPQGRRTVRVGGVGRSKGRGL